VVRTLDRSKLGLAQTPQAFRTSVLRNAHQSGPDATDDAALCEAMGASVVVVEGRPENLKITDARDLELASALLGMRVASTGGHPARAPAPVALGASGSSERMVADAPVRNGADDELLALVRTGLGVDIHRLSSDARRPLVLGGVEVASGFGLVGHSDADVVVHALADALLGAARLGDLGRHFPDTDPAWKGVDSMVLLRHVVELVAGEGFVLANGDCTVIAQRPRLASYMPEMAERLTEAARGPVSVKATTPEGMGPLGGGEGIACLAVVTLVPRRGR